ncbi:MAG: protein-L-isoaspartate O-methyltransferase [Candidatus Nanohalobium sp.]
MNSNSELVDRLVERGHIESGKVEEAFRNVDRAVFVPDRYQDKAYADSPLPIAEEATISAPHMVATNTELLDVDESSTVVEIGSGSGYQLAILSQLTEGKVIGVEIIEELVEKSRERLSERENVTVFKGSGFEPVEDKLGEREFDRILYSCAINSLKEAREHLKEDGTAVAPVYGNGAQILKKLDNGEITEHGPVRFVPFVENREDM